MKFVTGRRAVFRTLACKRLVIYQGGKTQKTRVNVLKANLVCQRGNWVSNVRNLPLHKSCQAQVWKVTATKLKSHHAEKGRKEKKNNKKTPKGIPRQEGPTQSNTSEVRVLHVIT